MKRLNKVSIAILFALSISPIYAETSLLDNLQFNKSDSVLSDQIYYQIGGGSGYMTPPTRQNPSKPLNLGLVGKPI